MTRLDGADTEAAGTRRSTPSEQDKHIRIHNRLNLEADSLCCQVPLLSARTETKKSEAVAQQNWTDEAWNKEEPGLICLDICKVGGGFLAVNPLAQCLVSEVEADGPSGRNVLASFIYPSVEKDQRVVAELWVLH